MEGNKYVSIPEFYAGKSVFLTGGSGYLGKVLIEKLLYSCPLLDKIYMLLRDKKSVKAEQRLKTMLELPIFSRLKAENPDALSKIVLIGGELTAPNLNMTPEDLQTIRDKVSVVIHSAATIKFNEPLKVAMVINVDGTRNVLNLCHSLKNIQSFVYVSTAYCNSNRQVIEEVIYPPPASIARVNKLIEQGDEGEDVTKILNGLPNTYTFSKAIAENLVLDIHGDIPTVIVRPSIVAPAKDEPLKGWVDNWFGATALLTTVGKGICRVVYAADDNIVDLIPVDYVCNLMLIAAARAKRYTGVAVYNSCSGSTNPIRAKQIFNLYAETSVKNKFNDLPYPELMLCTTRYWLLKIITILMFLFAQVADFFTRLTRNRSRFTELVTQAVMVRDLLEYFTSHSWIMKTERSQELYESLSAADARQFPCLARDINWTEYMLNYFQGVKTYVMEKRKK